MTDSGRPLVWCPRCNARLRGEPEEACPHCGLPADVFRLVGQMRREYVAAITELTVAHRAAIEALVRDTR